MNIAALFCCSTALAAFALSAFAQNIPITNPGFEANILSNPNAGASDNFIVSVGEGVTPVAAPGWTFAFTQTDAFTSYGGISDLATGNHAPEGLLENNILWLFIGANKQTGTVSAAQTLAATVQLNTRYTLNLRVAQSAHAEGNVTLPNPAFPTLGDGVSTGDVFARLRAGNLSTALPGFLTAASSVSIPADDTWVNWQLVWEIGSSQPLAGQPLILEFFNRANTVSTNLPVEVFFDDVTLLATPVPEPASAAFLALATVLGAARRFPRNLQIGATTVPTAAFQ